MSSELRVKKLRGSGGYVMASVNDEQQMKANLGGPDLFLAPIGRLNQDIISKHFCNTCEKEFEGSPKIEYENPNEEVAENLILAEKGQYICNSCNSTIAEYREFKKQDEVKEIGAAKPIEATVVPPERPAEQIHQIPETSVPKIQPVTEATSAGSVNSIEGIPVYDENAKKIGTAKQVGIDANQTVVLSIIKNDGTQGSVPWNSVGKVGDIILLGNASGAHSQQPGKCSNCGFVNNEGSKFCEECGTKLQ